MKGVRLSDDERARSRAMIVDANGCVLAASDGAGALTERLAVNFSGRKHGYELSASGQQIVAFHHTPGYETYDGLGWYGVISQQLEALG